MVGSLINELVYQIAARDRTGPGAAVRRIAQHTGYSEATVYRWRRNQPRPSAETLERLVQLGWSYGMERRWAEQLLRYGQHPNAAEVLLEHYGPAQIRQIPHNLPPPAYSQFIGKNKELSRLLELLSPTKAVHPIVVDGIGGVGKTTLVLEAAYRCLRVSRGEVVDPQTPSFDAIIFISAKQRALTPYGITSLPGGEAGFQLRHLFREIALVLNRHDIRRAKPDKQWEKAKDALANQRTLLIVDNLETVPESEREAILQFIFSLPVGVKAVITTRERIYSHAQIQLSELSEEEAIELLLHEAGRSGVSLTPQEAQRLYQRLGGIPMALVYAIGQMALGAPVDFAMAKAAAPQGDVARFCFEESVRLIQDRPAYPLLMAVAMFPKRPLDEAVIHVAGLADNLVGQEELVRLAKLNLIERKDRRCRMLPLTREYVLAELSRNPNFEQEARERWVKWHVQLAQRWGGPDRENYHIPFARLREEWENIRSVVEWCMENERYEEAKSIWMATMRFARLDGEWETLLSWLEWLIPAAERRGDQRTMAYGLNLKVRLLYLMGRQEEAREWAEQAWHMSSSAGTLNRASAARLIGCLLMRENHLKEALDWLRQGLHLLEGDEKEEEEGEEDRRRLRAAIMSHMGECLIQLQELGPAKEMLRKALGEAEAIGWQRSRLITQIRLALVAIQEPAGDLNEAERLLLSARQEAERIGDQELVAFCKRFQADLAMRKGEKDQAQQLAYEAMTLFQQLGMEWEADMLRRSLELYEL